MSTASDDSESTTAAAQATEQLTTSLAAADTASAQSLQSLQQVHQARLAQQTRAAASLTAQFGAADARTIKAQAAVAASNATITRVSIVSQQHSTAAPEVAAKGWALHGRVFNSQFQSAANLTVFLVDAQKNFLRQYGFAYTDSTGYFLLNYAGAAHESSATGQLFIEVASKTGKPIYLSATPFVPTTGSAAYQNITLPAGEKPLGIPPQAIRAAAFPSKDEIK
ncbi:MAG TPA: hypothetical protein VGO59_01580 [Verrucomicrobiae bacterium]|jgi:hypothetical protein